MKKLFALILLFFAISSSAQNSTDELLDSRNVRNYIHFMLIDSKLYYELDKITNKQSHKTLPSDLCITVEKRDREISMVFDYINPFKQKIILTETMEADGAYESLSKFYTAMKGLNGQLSLAASSEPGQGSVDPSAYKAAGESGAAQTAKDQVAQITAKSLTSWKYHFLNSTAACVKSDDLFEKLTKADLEFYKRSDVDDENFFPAKVEKINQELLTQESVSALKSYQAKLPSKIAELEKLNTEATSLLAKLTSWDYTSTFNTSTKSCNALKDYTKESLEHFLEDATALLEKRKATVKVLNDVNNNVVGFLKNCDEKDNIMIVGRIPVSIEKVKIETIKLRDVSFKLDNYELILAEEEKKDVELGKLRIRNYHLLIPEFALGAFYTDLNYPFYSTGVNGTSTVVSGPDNQNYSLVAAASLNLVVNMHGLVNPMLQFGVGTAKELPSFLAGGGIRLSKPNHLSISFGGLWTWKKELDKLKVGDIVADNQELQNDLKYKFITKPSFYLGLNFGF